MKNMVSRLSAKTALRFMLAGCILLALAISSIGIYFSLKKPTGPELPMNLLNQKSQETKFLSQQTSGMVLV